MGDAQPLPGIRLSQLGLALSPDGARIAANQAPDRKLLGLGETSGTVLWDTAGGEILERFDNGRTGALAWQPDAELLAVGGRTAIDITDPSGTLLWQMTGHGDAGDVPARIEDLAFSPDGGRLASLSTDGTVRLWQVDADRCAPEHVLQVEGLQATSLAFSPDGGTLAVCGPGQAPELWDPATGERQTVLEDLEGSAYGLAYAHDGALLIGTGEPVALHVVEPEGSASGAPAPLSQRPMHIAPGSGERVAVGGENDNQVMVWDRGTDERRDLPRVPGSVGRLRWSPDETVLYGVSQGEGVLAWDDGDWRPFELP